MNDQFAFCLADQLEGGTCKDAASMAGYSWVTVGKGLLDLLKIGGMISSAFCLSLSVASISTCGGLSMDTCQVC